MNNNFYISLNVYVVCLCLFCIIFEVIGIKVIVWINFLLFINGNNCKYYYFLCCDIKYIV